MSYCPMALGLHNVHDANPVLLCMHNLSISAEEHAGCVRAVLNSNLRGMTSVVLA